MGKKQKILILFIIISIITIIFSNRNKNQTQQYNHENPYFYTSTEKKVEYEGYFYLWSYTDIWQNIHLNITELAAFENGILYTLELDQLNVTDPLDEINLGRRYLGYFYVTGQAIYYVSTKTMDGYTEAENREVIDQIQTNEAKFKKNSTVVCCENGTSDIMDEQGYHAFVEVDGERRIFRYYNDYFYGSKDYMLMVWERGKGLVYYLHGNGGKNMHVEFGVDLKKEQQTDYGYPYKLFHDAQPDIAESEADSKDITQVISDYLQMDSFEFESHYKKDELYKRGILYCDKNAWKYDGSQLDAFQENNYNIENITAIRFYKKQSAPIYQTLNIGTQTSQSTERISIYYQTDYAVTIYRKTLNDQTSQIEEISFVKIKPDKGTAPEALYQFIENDYYDVRENLKNETWFPSPNGEKAVCISNGALPKHPAQIFIRYQDDKPYTIFRRTWEQKMVGWIDNDHFICYAVDVDTPVLVHLERNEIEPIITGTCQYDTYGVKYEIQENTLIAQAFGEQIYRWEIAEKDGEIMVVDVNVPLSALEESRVPDLTDYSAYLKKIWIVDGWTDDEMRGGDYPVTLVITNLKNGQISGYLRVGGNIAYDYFALSGREKYISKFHGTIENGTAKCEYTESYKNKQGTITLTFQNDKVHHNDRIEAELEADAAQKYLLRPYNVFNESDVQFNEKLTTFEVELDSYGTGLIAYATMKCAHPYPRVFFVNHQGDILYEFSGSYRVYVNSTDVYDVLVADLNGDGRKDVKVMTFVNDLDNDEVGGEAYFYQEENGMFYLGLENDYYLDEPCRYCYSKEGELLYEINLAEKELEWNWVVKPEEYEDCFYLGENRIAVQKKNGYYGIINESGAFVFPEEYEEIGSYCEGIMRVRKKGAVYYIDRNGERITDTDFLDAHDFQEGKAAVMSKNGLWGVINRKGEAMTEFQWNEMRNFSEGLVAVQLGNKWGFINVTGESIISCQYDEVRDFQEGYAAVRQGSQWGFVDRFGKKKIACQFDAVKDFQEGYAAVRREDKWGFINRKGEVSIAFLYDEAGSFSEGKAAVKRKNYLNGYMDAWAYINPDNAVVIDYDVYAASEGRMEYAGAFQDGMAFVSDGYYSIIDAEGNRIFDGQDSRFIISSFDYNKTYDAIPGYVYADHAMTIKKYGLVGLNGKQRLAPEFDYVHGIVDSYVLISQKIDGDWKYGIIKLQEESK